MKALNYKQIRKKTFSFWIYFFILCILAFLPLFLLFKSYEVQNSYIIEDIDQYKATLNKQHMLYQKVDSLYNQLALLNSGKVENNIFLEKYITDNKNDIKHFIGKDSTAFSNYSFLIDGIDNMLVLKDTTIAISNKESMALNDLMECMNKTRKIKKDLAFDPSRNFSSNKK